MRHRQELENGNQTRSDSSADPPTTRLDGRASRVADAGRAVTRIFVTSSQTGSSPAKPEFGQEIASEGEALIEGFQEWSAVLHIDGMESGSGGEWRRQSCDCETGCRPETDSKLVRKDQHEEFSDDQAIPWSFERPAALCGEMC